MRIGIAVRYFENKYYINESYINYFNELGFPPTPITLNTNLEDFDFFILPGGYDIDPKYYNEENTSSYHIEEYNDALDFKIIEYANKHQKLLLGICRGLQSINVFFGGTLNQDISNHKDSPHLIRVQTTYYYVNSFHHQSIKKLAEPLEPIATALDGTIEIIRYKKIIGVQFHPEIMNSPIINTLIFSLFNEA